jgi:hypothetical protein
MLQNQPGGQREDNCYGRHQQPMSVLRLPILEFLVVRPPSAAPLFPAHQERSQHDNENPIQNHLWMVPPDQADQPCRRQAALRRTSTGSSPATSSDPRGGTKLRASSRRRPLQRDSRARDRLRDSSSCFGASGGISLGILDRDTASRPRDGEGPFRGGSAHGAACVPGSRIESVIGFGQWGRAGDDALACFRAVRAGTPGPRGRGGAKCCWSRVRA